MDDRFKYHLIQPCKNRSISIEKTINGIKLNGKEFFTMKEAEDYIESFKRIDQYQ